MTPEEEEEEEVEEIEHAEDGGDGEVVDEFESVEEEKEPEAVDEFESVEEEKEPEVVEEFDGFDENAPDDITTSGFKTKGGEIPDYEPTVDEVLSYAMGKTSDPSEPVEAPLAEKDAGEGLASVHDKAHEPVEETEEVEAPGEVELPPEIEEALDEIIEEIAPTDTEAREAGEAEEGLDADKLADVFDDDEDGE